MKRRIAILTEIEQTGQAPDAAVWELEELAGLGFMDADEYSPTAFVLTTLGEMEIESETR